MFVEDPPTSESFSGPSSRPAPARPRERSRREPERVDERLQRGLDVAIEQTADAVVLLDRRGRVRHANPAYLAWSRMGRDEVVGRPVWRLPGRPVDREDLVGGRRRLAAGEVWSREVRCFTRDVRRGSRSSLRWAHLTVSPVRDEDGTVVGHVAIGRDVTERRRLEAIAEAQNFQETLGFAFQGLRHELGNPVNSLKSALQFVTGNVGRMPEEKLRSYLKAMSGEVARMEYLLRSLRTFGLFQSVELEVLQLGPFFGKSCAHFREQGLENEARCSFEIEPGAERVLADPHALSQILLNLATNAVQAMRGRPDPSLSVTARPAGRRVEILVRDTGPGVSAEIGDSVFEPFFTTRSAGTGLGLTICRRLATLLGGNLELGNWARGAVARLTLEKPEV